MRNKPTGVKIVLAPDPVRDAHVDALAAEEAQIRAEMTEHRQAIGTLADRRREVLTEMVSLLGDKASVARHLKVTPRSVAKALTRTDSKDGEGEANP